MSLGYVTAEEALSYVQQHYTSKDPQRFAWEALSLEDQEALLRKSLQCLETLPFTGRKSKPDQDLAFPRFPSESVPEAIKAAQIENALSLEDSSTVEDQQFYEKLWMYGVSSYSIGNLSESTSTGVYQADGAQASGIVSAVARRLLQPFLRGGYRIWGG